MTNCQQQLNLSLPRPRLPGLPGKRAPPAKSHRRLQGCRSYAALRRRPRPWESARQRQGRCGGKPRLAAHAGKPMCQGPLGGTSRDQRPSRAWQAFSTRRAFSTRQRASTEAGFQSNRPRAGFRNKGTAKPPRSKGRSSASTCARLRRQRSRAGGQSQCLPHAKNVRRSTRHRKRCRDVSSTPASCRSKAMAEAKHV